MQVASSPALIANEPGNKAIVFVGPPLSASAPSLGSPLFNGEQEPSSIRLLILVMIPSPSGVGGLG